MKRIISYLFMSTICAVSIAATAFAQQAGGPVVSVSAADLSVKEMAAKLSAQASTPVVSDGETGKKYSGSFNAAPLEQILDSVAKTTGTRWVKAYIPTATPKAEEVAAAKSQVALLDQLNAAKTTMIYDPSTKSQIILTKSAPDPAADDADAKALGLKPVYLLYAPAPPPVAKAPVVAQQATSYADLGRQQQDEFLRMTPEQRASAMEQQFASEMAMDPTTRAQYHEARMQTMQALRESNSPIYQQWRDSMRQSWRGRGGGPGGGPPDGNWRNGRQRGDSQPQAQ